MSSATQHAEVWEPLAFTDFSCTCHKVCHVGEQPEQIFDPNQPYGPNMVAQVQAIWSGDGCCCRRLVSCGVFFVLHVELPSLPPFLHQLPGGEGKKNTEWCCGGISCKTQTVWYHHSLLFACGAARRI